MNVTIRGPQTKNMNTSKKFLWQLGFLIGLVFFLSNDVFARTDLRSDDEFAGTDLPTNDELAETYIRYGRIEIHPVLKFGVEYNDNIFLEADKTFANNTSEGRSDDLILVTSPGILFKKRLEKGEFFGFNLGYVGTDEHFVNLGSENTFKHDLIGDVTFGGPGGRSQLILGGRFLSTKDASSSEFASNNDTRLDRNLYQANLDMEWQFSQRFLVNFHADLTRNDYKSDVFKNEDKDTWNVGAGIFRELTPLTLLGLRYNFRLMDFHEISTTNSDSHINSYFAAIKWKATALVVGEIALGYSDRNFNTLSGQDRQDFVFQVNLTYQPRQRTRISFKGFRRVDDASFVDIQTVLKHQAELKLFQDLGKKFQTIAEIYYEKLDYETIVQDTKGGGDLRVREDDKIHFSLALIYNIQKWLKAKAKYSHEVNSSNFDDKDYTNNIILLSLSVIY